MKASYVVLNLKDKAELRNGYRYVRNYFYNIINFQMNQDFFKSKLNNANAYSVKTDAFVIDTCNVEKARHLVEFHIDIGGWKVSKQDEEINLPTIKNEVARNEIVEIPFHESKTVDIIDEYDIDKIIEVSEPNNPMMIRAWCLPGHR